MDAPLDTVRPSTRGWLLGTLAGWGTILLALLGIILFLLHYGAYFLALTVIALLIIAWRWLENMGSKYEITEERLIIRRGIFYKSIDEIELYRVKDVRLDFTLINQWAGIGTLCVSSSDETTRAGDLLMRHIERAQPRREELRRLVDVARRKRGVRELDMAHDHA